MADGQEVFAILRRIEIKLEDIERRLKAVEVDVKRVKREVRS